MLSIHQALFAFGVGTAESAFLVTEKLALQQVLGHDDQVLVVGHVPRGVAELELPGGHAVIVEQVAHLGQGVQVDSIARDHLI